MKKLYFSTFVEGLEKPIEAMLHKEGGVAVERVLNGAALYRSVREPALPYMHQTFQVLFQMKPMANVNDAVRRLLATGGWLDRFPYEETQGKKFRIVTAQDDHLVSANMRYVDMLEKAICEHTGMHTYRERPDVELWVLCRPEAAYFLWRLGKRQPKQEGQLRSDVCAVAAFFAALRREERRHSRLHRQRPARGSQGLRRSRADLYLPRPRDGSFDRKQGERNAGLRRLQRIYGFGGRQPERRSDVSAGQGGENRAA